MSMMMPPGEAPPALPNPGMPPGGLGPPGPMDPMNAGPIPAEGGMAGLLAALGGPGPGGEELAGPGPGGPGPGGPGLPESEGEGSLADMDPIQHIQHAMKHLMMAIAKDEDDERGLGVTKGMGALQGILAGEQKKNAQLSALTGA